MVSPAFARIDVNGDADYLNAGSANALDPGTSDISASVRIQADDSSGWPEGGWIWNWTGDGTANEGGTFGLYLNTSGNIAVYAIVPNATWPGDYSYCSSVGTYDDSSPHTVGYSYDRSAKEVTLFVDGASICTDTFTGTADAPVDQASRSMNIGCRYNSDAGGYSEFFNGQIWDFHYWTGWEMMLADHQAIHGSYQYSTGLDVHDTGTLWHWPLDDIPVGKSGLNNDTWKDIVQQATATGVDADGDSSTTAETYVSYKPAIIQQ